MNKERLLKLADHLESNQLGHEKFNIRQYTRGVPHVNRCGTIGCAVGETPFAFPGEVTFGQLSESGAFYLNLFLTEEDRLYNFFAAARQFFDLNESEASHLFLQDAQLPHAYGGIKLTNEATPQQVASNIRAFVSKLDQ